MTTEQLRPNRHRKLERNVAKAHTRDHLGTLRRFATVTADGVLITRDPPIVLPLDDLLRDRDDADELRAGLYGVLDAYRATLEAERRVLLDRYRLVDVAHEVVGVGSVGTRCWMILLLGNDERVPLFLQAKEAGPSVLEAFAGRRRYGNAGRRVVVGQRMMQAVSDIFLG